jgi:hypothetical protein
MDTCIFSEDFRRQLELGKYTWWARDLSEAHLGGLLWMLGEFGFRAGPLLDVLDEHAEQFPHYARGRIALHAIRMIVLGERFDMAEAGRRIRRRRAHLEQADVPEGIMTAASCAAPGTIWERIGMSATGYVMSGADSGGRENVVSVSNTGMVSVRTSIGEADVPAVVIKGLEAVIPHFKVFGIAAIGPTSTEVLHYEFWVGTRADGTRKVLVSADGKHVELPRARR